MSGAGYCHSLLDSFRNGHSIIRYIQHLSLIHICVRVDGTNATIIGPKPGEFIADRNHITRVWMDHGMWPLLTTAFYIDQTGDLSILLEKAPYFKDAQIIRGTAKDANWNETQGCWQRDAQGDIVQGDVYKRQGYGSTII